MALGPQQKKIILELGDAGDWVPTNVAYKQQYHSLHAKGLIVVTGSNKSARLTAEGVSVYTALKHPDGIGSAPKDVPKVGKTIRKATTATVKKDPEALGGVIAEYGLMPDDLATLRKFASQDRDYTRVRAWIELPTLDTESDYKPNRRVQRLLRDEMIKTLIAPYMRLVAVGLAYCDLEDATEDGVDFYLTWDGKKVWHLLK